MTEGRVTYSFFMLRAKSWLMTDAGRALEWHSPQVWSWRAYDEDIRFRYGLIKLILILIKRCIINKNTFLITAVTTVTITRTLTIVANSLRKLIDCTAILIANILAAKNLLLCQNVALSAKPSPSFLFFFFLSIKEEIKSSNFSKHHPYYQQGCTLFKDQLTAREIQK